MLEFQSIVEFFVFNITEVTVPFLKMFLFLCNIAFNEVAVVKQKI